MRILTVDQESSKMVANYLIWMLSLIFFIVSPQPTSAAEEPVYLSQPPVPTPGIASLNAANFEEMRNNVLDLMSGSKKRIWLLTDYLTDGEIVSALYLAKYRKVDVKVLLGRERQNLYLSRLNYLKAHNIPVFVRPQHGYLAPTLLLVDLRLYTISRDLNSLSRVGSVQIAQVSPSGVKSFVGWMKGVLEYPEATQTVPEPTIGRRLRQLPQSYPTTSQQQSEPLSSYTGEDDGSYNYNRSNTARQAPEGVATQLPKIPLWQKNQNLNKQAPPIAPSAASSKSNIPETPSNLMEIDRTRIQPLPATATPFESLPTLPDETKLPKNELEDDR